jgi:hypothetical protein
MRLFNYPIKIEVVIFTVALIFLVFIAGAAAVYYKVPVIYGAFEMVLPDNKDDGAARKEKNLKRKTDKKKKDGEI